MGDETKLRLVKRASPSTEANSFRRCCPIDKSLLPDTDCSEGQPNLDRNNKVSVEPACPWWINSEPHNYCFWKYVADKSDTDGSMRELVQSELAVLFGFSNTKAHFVLKQAIEELKSALRLHGVADMLNDLEAEDIENLIVPEDFADSTTDEPA